MSIETNFVPYQIALDMKLLGFDEPCFTYYGNISTCLFGLKGDIKFHTNTLLDIGHGKNVVSSAPLYSQAFKWLYQKLDIEKGVMPLDIESQQLLLKELIDKVSSKHLLV
jgi:hypothetical protein